jgi:hypothetical protein
VNAWYAALASEVVALERLSWPSLGHFTGALKWVQAEVDARGGSDDIEDLLATCRQTQGLLTGTPLSPSDEEVGLIQLFIRLQEHLEAGRDSGVRDGLVRLLLALEALETEEHPAAAILEDIISRYGSDEAAGAPGVYVAVRGRAQQALVARWLADQELEAEVCTATALKETGLRDALVMLGPPSRYYLSQWCNLPRADMAGAWMLTAPPARTVHVLTWSGHPPFQPERCRLFAVSEPPAVVCNDHQPPAPEASTTATWHWLEPRTTPGRVGLDAWSSDREPVDARGIRLAGNMASVFAEDTGPRPQVVVSDAREVHVSAVTPSTLHPGQVLLFHSDQVAPALRADADRALTARLGASAAPRARALQKEIKDALSAFEGSRAELIEQLTARLGSRPYARHVVHRLADEDYIAPEKDGAYDAVRELLGLGADNGDAYRLLRELRAEHRLAGHRFSKQLRAVMDQDRSWQAALEEEGVATVVSDNNIGALEIRVIAAIDPELKRVGRSRLGRLFAVTTDGRLGGQP